MNSFFRRCARWSVMAFAAVLCACVIGPQVPTIRLDKVARAVPGAEPRWQQVDPGSVGLRVWRAGRELRPVTGMLLQPDDVVETGPVAAAVIRFSASGTTVLDANTRVRVGSLEVFFGRVFANVRGFFQTSSETVVAGVAGTRFLFQVRPDRVTRVAVVEGVVTCSPRRGAWTPVRLLANEALALEDPVRGQPQRLAADTRELRDAADWAQRVSNAPAPKVEAAGWCCSNGRVTEMHRSQCRGTFSDSVGVARRTCAARYEVPAPIR